MSKRGLQMACVLLMLMNKASLDQTVEAVEGSSVTLPCYLASADVPTRVEELNIFWRYNDDNKVFDIVSGTPFENRDPSFRNRTEGFEVEEYLKGNFSIKLSDVRASDQGEYSCYMHFADIIQKVHLQVKAAQPTTKTTVQTTTESKNKGVESRAVKSFLIFSVLLGYNVGLL